MNSKLDTILELARRYDYDAVHAAHVECLVGTLFMELEALHRLSRENRKLLEYAAILHDIGSYISDRGHHRHTLQMIMMEPLTAFSRDEKTVIANVARYHRKALPSLEHTAYGILSDADKRRVNLLAPLLRIADALDHSRRSHVKELSCEVTEDAVILHAGAEGDLAEERASVERRSDMFGAVYGREIRLNVFPPRLRFAPISPDNAPGASASSSAGPL